MAKKEHRQPKADNQPKYQITLSDNEKQIVTESELREMIKSAYTFDGFLGFTYKKINP